jgi:hypothetical protein
MFRHGESQQHKIPPHGTGADRPANVSALLTGIAALGWNGRRDKAVLSAPKPRRAKDGMQRATA